MEPPTPLSVLEQGDVKIPSCGAGVVERGDAKSNGVVRSGVGDIDEDEVWACAGDFGIEASALEELDEVIGPELAVLLGEREALADLRAQTDLADGDGALRAVEPLHVGVATRRPGDAEGRRAAAEQSEGQGG